MIAWLVLRTGFSAFLIKAVLVVALVAGVWASFAIWKRSIYQQGYDACDVIWTEKALEAKIEKLEREKAVAEKAAADEAEKNAELEADKAKLEAENDAYEEEIKKRVDQCPLGDDADRLQ